MWKPSRTETSSTLLLILLSAVLGLTLGCPEEPAGPDPDPPRSRYLHVPEDYGSIAEAVASALQFDTIVVAPGLYTGDGFRDINVHDKNVYIRSESGPRRTILDLQGDSAEPHFGFAFTGRSDEAVLDGFTIRNGYSGNGAGANFTSTNPTVINCLFVNNSATASGGAVRCKGSSPQFINCTFVGNSAPAGGAVWVIAGSSPGFSDCIIAFSQNGGAVGSSENTSIPQFECSNIFGNTGGDWTGKIEYQSSHDGNRSIDPIFCDPLIDDFRLRIDSPMLTPGDNCQTVAGILETGCN